MSKGKESKLGAVTDAKGVHFGVWAPFADSVAVTGSFNEWSPIANPLSKDDSGCWYGRVDGAKEGQEYKFIIKNGDQNLERNDPRALQITASGDASVIVGSDFSWDDTGFKLPPVNQRIVYELHIGTFHRHDPATPGNFETAIEKLDYLKNLGVNVVELMPVNSTTVDRWWGYDPDYLFAVDAAYGGRRAFMSFVNEAHKRGIGVLLDVVYNHMSPFPGLDMWQFDGWSQDGKGGIYFYNDWRGDTPWGPRLDYGRPEVRQFINDNVRMWLRDCHVDGLRVDAVFQIRNAVGHNDEPSTDIPDGWRVMTELTRAVHEEKADGMAVAEDMAINHFITKPESQGGAGFDAQWETSFPSLLRAILNPVGDADRDLQPLIDSLQKRYNDQAFQRVIYSESHDADANGHARTNEEISPGDADSLFARRRSALAAVITLTAPGIPMLFQGQEFMENGWFSHWKALDWNKSDEHHGIVQLYTDLNALRKNYFHNTAGLTGPNISILHHSPEHKVLAYHRLGQGGPGDDTVVVINFSNQKFEDYQLTFPSRGNWKVRFNSDWTGYGADFTNTRTPDVVVSSSEGAVNLGPYSAIILSQDSS